MFRSWSLRMNELDKDFVFVNKNANSTSLSSSKGGEKSWMDSQVRKRSSQMRKQPHLQRQVPAMDSKKSLIRASRTSAPAQRDSQSAKLPDQKQGPECQSRSESTDSASYMCSCVIVDGSARGLAALSEIAAPLSMLLSEAKAHADGHRSLAFFRGRTLLEAAGWADDYFWNHVALPMSETHPAMFFALASLGSLHESLTSREKSPKRAARNRSLELCNQAIQLTVAKAKDVPLTSLLPLCVVFTTIQMFECVAMAHANLRHGISLVTAAKIQDISTLSSTELDVLDTVEELFERYQCRLTLIMEPVSVLRQHRFALADLVEAPTMPPEFSCLYEARVYLERLNTWSYQLASHTGPDTLSQRIQPYHGQWLQAISMFPQEQNKDSVDYYGPKRSVNLLKAARIVSLILICTMHASEQMVYDKYIDLFREIVELYEPCIACIEAKPRYHFTFGFDAGMIETLALVGSACRDSYLRQRAIDMLHRSARVEGAITSGVAALIGTQWRLIEEEGLDTDEVRPSMIPESRRVRVDSLDFFTRVGMARLHYIRAPYLPGANAKIVERWFKIKEANSGNLRCFTSAAKALKDLGPAEILARGFAASNVKKNGRGVLPWPEAFTMKSSRLFFPIPKV